MKFASYRRKMAVKKPTMTISKRKVILTPKKFPKPNGYGKYA